MQYIIILHTKNITLHMRIHYTREYITFTYDPFIVTLDMKIYHSHSPFITPVTQYFQRWPTMAVQYIDMNI